MGAPSANAVQVSCMCPFRLSRLAGDCRRQIQCEATSQRGLKQTFGLTSSLHYWILLQPASQTTASVTFLQRCASHQSSTRPDTCRSAGSREQAELSDRSSSAWGAGSYPGHRAYSYVFCRNFFLCRPTRSSRRGSGECPSFPRGAAASNITPPLASQSMGISMIALPATYTTSCTPGAWCSTTAKDGSPLSFATVA